jgi:dolichol-phosphate mannosyltransferase
MDSISRHAVAAPLPERAAAPRPAPEIGIVVTNVADRDDVERLVGQLSRVLADLDWEVVVVGDAAAVGPAAAAAKLGETDSRVHGLRRVGRRGLVGACLEGMLASGARYLAVMELHHDVSLLAVMLDRLRQNAVDVVVAGGAPAMLRSDAHPGWLSRIVQKITSAKLDDPMSRFFMIRRDAFEELVPALSSQSISILLDLLLAARGRLRVAALPGAIFDGGKRSSLDPALLLEFSGLVVARLTRDTVSIRFLMFCLVGLTGVGIHLAILRVGLLSIGLPFFAAQTAAAIGAMVWNFTLNNVFTYYDQRLAGRAFFIGLVRFQLICAIGAISNIGAGSLIYSGNRDWWVAGLGGILMGAVWNYAVTSVFVWRKN